MIKNLSFLTESLILSSHRLISVSGIFHGKWFYMKKIKAPQTVIPTFPDDWEHKLGLTLSKSTPLQGVEKLMEYQQLPDFLKKTYTYNFLHNKYSINHEANVIAADLGVDKLLQPLAYRIIINTVKIRFQKLSIKQQNKEIMMLRGLKYLIGKRKKDLRQLSMENGELTDKICNELSINIVNQEPRKYESHNPKLQPFFNEMSTSKLKKIKIFKEELKMAEKDFYKNKKIQLEEIKEDMRQLNLNIEEVYDEVIKDRQEKSMEPIYKDKYGWFEKEKELKEYYAKKEKEKKEARERQQRR